MNNNEKQKEKQLNKSIVTWILLITNILIFFICEDETYRFGASYHSVLVNEEFYRIFTAWFCHADFWHIALNMFFLYAFGTTVEGKLGSMKFIIIYIVAGIGSDFMSMYCNYIFRPEYDVYSVGASGAIFGLLSASLILEAKEEGKKIVNSVITAVIGMVIYSIITWRVGVDIFGHLGGAILGGIITGILAIRYRKEKKERVFLKVLAICIVSILVVSVIGMISE